MQLVVISTALLCLTLVASNPTLSLKKELLDGQNLIDGKISISKGHNTVKVIEKPYLVKKPVIKKTYVDVKVPSPYPVLARYAVPVPKAVKVPVPQGIPTPIWVPVGRAVPVKIRYPVPIFVRVPVPAPIPVPKRVPTPLPVKTPVPYPVPILRRVAVPVGVARPFLLGHQNYISPGWSALGLTDALQLGGLKAPLDIGSWQGWAKNIQLESGSILGNVEALSNLNSLESLQNLQNLQGLKGLGSLEGIKNIDNISLKTLGSSSGLSLSDLKGINDLDIIVDNNLSKTSKSVKISEVEKETSSKKSQSSIKVSKTEKMG